MSKDLSRLGDEVLKEVLHEQPEDLPQLDSFGRQREPGRVA
jgi:hypothetical protein